MAVDPSILQALAAGVANDPTNAALRLHYAELLLQSGQAGEALAQCQSVLAASPDYRAALTLGAEAAQQAGQPIVAHGYRRLAEALGMSVAKGMIDEAGDYDPPSPRVGAAPEEDECEVDEDGLQELERIVESLGDAAAPREFDTERPEVTLKDVAGLEEVKNRLEVAFLGPMRNEELRKLFKKSLRGGLLLYGPPGCGKTHLARAVAGELGARFLSVGLTDVIDMYLGESEKNLRAVFHEARRSRPTVLFFDEIDALGRKRSLMRENAGRSVINQLLAELDGVEADNEGVFVLAATNHPWDVDAALRRPGRFDRTLLVLPPDAPAREAILRMNLEGRPHEGIEVRGIVARTEDYSGADLAHLVESGAELALADSIRKGRARPIVERDLIAALKDVRPSIRSWLETAKNYAVFANEGGTYDELLDYLRRRRLV